jgi:hypothetical protein
MKLAMDLTLCNKDPLPLQSQCILPACYSLWCDNALHGIYHWIHKALVIFPQSDQHASVHLHTCPQQAQILTNPHNNRHFHYTHGPVYWNAAQQVDSLRCMSIPLLCHVSDAGEKWIRISGKYYNGKEMVMRIIVQLRNAKPKNLVGNNGQRTSHGAVSKICHVGPYPLHTARVQKSSAPDRRGD